jgi:hypothetical protein
MRVRTFHRIVGIILILPLLGWALTGLVFFIKPGYAEAYELLSPRTYPMDGSVLVSSEPGWKEVRYFRTVLGDHLIVRTDQGWLHLNPSNKQPRNKPTDAEIKLLLKDAFSTNPQRYGEVTSISGDTIRTSTDVEVTLDWTRLALQQKGKDTDRIDLLYRIHYLRWTGVRSVDRVVGVAGIVLVLLLTALGTWLAVRG